MSVRLGVGAVGDLTIMYIAIRHTTYSDHMEKAITSHVEGQVVTITLNRPDKRNALNGDLVAALRIALEEAAIDDAVRCVVLTGAGNAFSAGADLVELNAMREATPMNNEADARRLAELFRTIYFHPKPVIARINGHAIAGGCGLAAVCDISIAAEGARLGFTEVRIGFVPAIVGVFVVRKLGEAATRDLLLRGRLVTAVEAVQMGLINQVVAAEDLDHQVSEITREIADETSASAVALTKRMLGHVPGMGIEEALAHAVQVNAFARGTADCQAGIEAFLDKKDPPWKAT